MTPDADSDLHLLQRWRRERDSGAFGLLVGRHSHAVRDAAERQLRHHGSTAEPDDAAQAAWVVLARRSRSAAMSARLHGSLAPWLQRTASLCAKTQARGERRRRAREAIAAQPDVAQPPAGDELAEVVATALRSLPRRERKILTLRHLDGRPWPEVAALCKTTPDAARKAASRAHDGMRRRLEKLGVTAAPAAIAAALARLAEAGRFAPLAPVLPAVLARKVLLMSTLKTTAVCSLATVGLLGGSAAYVATAEPGGTATTGPANIESINRDAAPAQALSSETLAGAPEEGQVLVTRVQQLSAENTRLKTQLARMTTQERTTRNALEANQAILEHVTSEMAQQDELPAIEFALDENEAALFDEGPMPGGLTPDAFALVHGERPAIPSKFEGGITFENHPLSLVVEEFAERIGAPIELHPSVADANVEITMVANGGLRIDHVLERLVLRLPSVITDDGSHSPVVLAWRYGTFMLLPSNALFDLDLRISDAREEKVAQALAATRGQ